MNCVLIFFSFVWFVKSMGPCFIRFGSLFTPLFYDLTNRLHTLRCKKTSIMSLPISYLVGSLRWSHSADQLVGTPLFTELCRCFWYLPCQRHLNQRKFSTPYLYWISVFPSRIIEWSVLSMTTPHPCWFHFMSLFSGYLQSLLGFHQKRVQINRPIWFYDTVAFSSGFWNKDHVVMIFEHTPTQALSISSI